MRKVVYLVLLILLTLSCGGKNRFSDVDLNNTPVQPVKIQRFDIDFFAVDTNNVVSSLENLRKKYDGFVDLYLNRIIGNQLQLINEDELTRAFLSDSIVRDFYTDVESKYTDLSDIEKKFTSAFQYVNYYFPEIVIPKVYTHVSGLEDVITVDDSLLSVSLDYFLGADYENYKHVAYEYMIPNFKREKIVPEAIFWWLTTEFPDHIAAPRLLENMIYYGKIMYLSEVFLPDETEENLMGYSKEQWKWVKNNEAQMWNYLMEHRHLFSTEAIITSKYINPAPFTAFFPDNSPGRTGIWIGWQIVRSYMDKNKDVSLPELMNNRNAQDILEKSGYRP